MTYCTVNILRNVSVTRHQNIPHSGYNWWILSVWIALWLYKVQKPGAKVTSFSEFIPLLRVVADANIHSNMFLSNSLKPMGNKQNLKQLWPWRSSLCSDCNLLPLSGVTNSRPASPRGALWLDRQPDLGGIIDGGYVCDWRNPSVIILLCRTFITTCWIWSCLFLFSFFFCRSR